MISTYLGQHLWMAPVAIGTTVLLGPLVGAWLAARPRWAAALAVVAWVVVAAATLWPDDRVAFQVCEVRWALPGAAGGDLPNTVLFLPAALLTGVALGRPVVAALGAGAASALIEAFQAALPDLGRSCSTNDWLSNSIGALAGGVLAWLALRLARYLAGTRQPAQALARRHDV